MQALFARIPTRVRVTVVFALVMAVLLAALGLFLYLRLATTLNETVDSGLRSRASDLAALVQQDDAALSEVGRSPLTERGESFAQILDRRGRIVDAPPALRRQPLLTPAEVRRATRRAIVVERRLGRGEGQRVRLLATPVRVDSGRLIVVAGASLAPSLEAQHNLGGLLLVGGPIALVIAALAGYGAAAGALRPVELMRRRAREIQASRPGQRLPVPPSNDEVARLGETLNEMLDRLEDAFARERRFVSDASHELRTPLTILKGELELALRDAHDLEAFRAAVVSAAEEADRLSQLAEDLLVIARADQGRLPVRLEQVEAGELLRSVARRFAARAEEHGAVIDVVAPEPVSLVADRLRLEQALGNMVENALRHSTGPVALRVVADGDDVQLHVLDRGPGFPPGFLDAAFERFTRGDAARGRGGAGLGLAIVQAVAAAHGGRSGAANRSGGGADVWLAIPGTPR